MTTIREVRRVDIEAITRWRNDPAIWRSTLGRPFPITLHNSEQWFETLGVGHVPESAVWTVADASDLVVGLVQLSNIHLIHRTAELGIWIGSQGQGHGRHATRLVLDAAFQDLGMRQVRLRVLSTNTRAIDIYRDAGFVAEGVLVGAAFVGGATQDVVVMRCDSPPPTIRES